MYQIAAGVGGLMLGAYFAYCKYNQNQTTTLQTNLTELINATGNEKLISQRDTLINELLTTGDDQQKKQAAWQAIIKPLNPEYYVARDNTIKFNKVQPHITALAAAASAAIDALNGHLKDNPTLAADIVQFIFKVSNYYSIASTLEQNNFDECTKWLLKARDFIDNNGLKNTLQDAIWNNLMGGHKSREYQMGRSTGRPSEAVTHFEEAVRIHTENLGSKLDNPNDIELRHVQMCLSSTLLQDVMWCVVNDGKVSEESQKSINKAKSLLEALTEEHLVLKNGTPDLYRRAGCLQSKGYILILEGNFEEAFEKMSLASCTMKHAIGNTGATGQLSAILNDEAGSWLALATKSKANAQDYIGKPNAQDYIAKAKTCLEESKKLSKGQFEQMYAENAEKMLAQINNDYTECFYSKLAASVIKPATPKAPRPSML